MGKRKPNKSFLPVLQMQKAALVCSNSAPLQICQQSLVSDHTVGLKDQIFILATNACKHCTSQEGCFQIKVHVCANCILWHIVVPWFLRSGIRTGTKGFWHAHDNLAALFFVFFRFYVNFHFCVKIWSLGLQLKFLLLFSTHCDCKKLGMSKWGKNFSRKQFFHSSTQHWLLDVQLFQTPGFCLGSPLHRHQPLTPPRLFSTPVKIWLTSRWFSSTNAPGMSVSCWFYFDHISWFCKTAGIHKQIVYFLKFFCCFLSSCLFIVLKIFGFATSFWIHLFCKN